MDTDTENPAPRARPVWVRVLRAGAVALAAVVVLVAALVLAINTGPGRGFLVRQIGKLELESGLRVRMERIDGSLYSRFTIRNLVLFDLDGPFLAIPAVTVDWKPGPLVRKHVVVRWAHAPEITLSRLPRLNPTPPEPDQPLFPDIYATLDDLTAERIVIGPKVAGQRSVASLKASGVLADGRLNLTADSVADAGDRLHLRLAAEPDRDRLDLDARLDAPAAGLVAGLAGLSEPLTVRLEGAGAWSAWNGSLHGQLAGEPLVNLALQARSGTFSLEGQVRPALVLEEGPATRLLSPALEVSATARFEEPRLVTTARVSAPAFAVDAQGAIDTGTSRFEAMMVNGRLLAPATVMDGLSGDDLTLAAELNGPVATPTIAYTLKARRIAFEGRGATDLNAEGRVEMEPEGRITAPITLSAASIDGLPEQVGGLLRQVRVNGTVEMTPERIGAKNLAFRSNRLNGRAMFAYAPATGAYDADVDASVQQYEVAGFGVVNASADARIAFDPRTSALALNGDINARATRLDNEAARDFLGGLPVLTVSARQRPGGAIVLNVAQLEAPRFRFALTEGVYTPDGRIVLAGQGESAAYGPFAINASGEAVRPQAELTLARPDLGIGLRNVVLKATPEPRGYAVALDGRSSEGPLRGRAIVVLEEGPLAAEISELSLADLTLKGRVEQTEAGPMAGALSLKGAGLTGQLRLAGEGAVQRMDASLQARQARPPVFPALGIGQAQLEASLRLPDGAPDVNARFSGRQIRYGDWLVEQTSGTVLYQSGTGRANLTLAGRYNAPFNLDLAAEMTPERVQLTQFNGTLSKRRIRLAQPAVADRVEAGWRLNPATLQLAGGKLTVEGETGETARLAAQWSGLGLSFLDAIDPEMGLSGTTSGTMTATLPPGGRTPRAEARIVVSNMQRAGLSTQSPPLDLGLNASLSEQQAAVRALVRHDGKVVGSLQARLSLPPQAEEPETDWMSRLRDAPLAGGLRFSGPVELLWALSGMKGHELGGTLSVSADMSGTPAQPLLRGTVRGADMSYENVDFGTRIRDVKLNARFEGSRLQLAEFSGTSPGGGGFSATGFADLDMEAGLPMNVQITLDHLRAAQTDALEAVITGPVAIRRAGGKGVIEGKLRINEARYRFTGVAAAEVLQLEVQRVGEVPIQRRPRRKEPEKPSPFEFTLNVDVDADNRIFIQGMGLDSEWGVDLNIGGPVMEPAIRGTVTAVRGSYAFAGRRFELNKGVIRFAGEFPPAPTLDIVAGATVDGIEAQLQVTGQALQPSIAFSSNPSLPQDEILSRLLFGGSVTELSATEALQLGAAVASLRGGGGGLNPLGKLRQATSIDRLRIVGGDEASGRGTSLAVGQYLTDDVYVEVTSDTHGNTLTQLQIELTRALSILSQVGRAGETSLQLQYAKDY